MAIPQGEMSVTPVEDILLPPEERLFKRLTSHEMGPLGIEDTTLGITYQPWTLTYDKITGETTLTPNTTGFPVVLATIVFGITDINFTFDQSGRLTLVWKVGSNYYLYWYNTSQGGTVTEDLGTDLLSVAIYLDDKRTTQNTANDMILWYTKADGLGTYTLYNKLQRERFIDEHIMSLLLPVPYLQNLGMHYGLRIQLTLSSEKQ